MHPGHEFKIKINTEENVNAVKFVYISRPPFPDEKRNKKKKKIQQVT